MRLKLSLFVIPLLLSPVAGAEEKRPNVLFLFADDLRADALGAYGNPVALTPNIDRLAKKGMRFDRSYIMGGNQGAVCVPSRAMMLSGRSFFRVDSQLTGVATWPMILRKLGYRTFFTGKWHNGAASAIASFPGAKNVFLGGMNDPFAAKLVNLPAEKAPFAKSLKEQAADKHVSERFADEAIRFLKSAPKEGPWALYVAFTAPHDPRKAPKEWHAKFDPASMPLPANYLPEHPFDNGEMKVRDEKLEAFPRTKDAIRRHLADYHAMLAHLDAQIGRILAELEARGELDNTIIIFAGDNGLAIGSHGLLGKQNLYDHSVRVPLIMAGPGIPANRRSDAMCYLLDLCPTICEAAGGAPPQGIAGKSLLPLLHGKTTTHRDALFFAYRDLQRAVYDGKRKAIHYPKIDRWQLFDLQTDPHETRDLIDDPARSTELAQLRQLLTRLQREFGDDGPAKKN
ncbi:MAG: sulfatase-like hydrolase/transferase [Gemmataceae bacterium]|nr:sulfatase-like hydrolase/transferase [Gemmataceae bacterium]